MVKHRLIEHLVSLNLYGLVKHLPLLAGVLNTESLLYRRSYNIPRVLPFASRNSYIGKEMQQAKQ